MARLAINEGTQRKLGMYNIVCQTVDGRKWKLNHRFAIDDPKLLPTLQRIDRELTIDPANWIEITRATKGYVNWRAF